MFTHRDGDENRTEGGGNGQEPKWLLPESLLVKKSEQLTSELNAFEATVAERERK
ncbi:MAG: hypothetical protein LBH32_06185 [Dysgonamonadaceae bacterium]|nr:hypothetical protein [Dysgonamonadaceae bacterium]